jgi:5-methylthioadenosine/S-adenosylhomocysteine deaminase
VYSRVAADVRTVIVNGQLVVNNRNLLTIDLRETCRQVRKLVGG